MMQKYIDVVILSLIYGQLSAISSFVITAQNPRMFRQGYRYQLIILSSHPRTVRLSHESLVMASCIWSMVALWAKQCNCTQASSVVVVQFRQSHFS